jgi:hypothetical protein
MVSPLGIVIRTCSFASRDIRQGPPDAMTSTDPSCMHNQRTRYGAT